jgi:integrase
VKENLAKLAKKAEQGGAIPEGDYQDEKMPYLHLYVTATNKSWGFYRWSETRRKPERRSIGKLHDLGYEAAKDQAHLLLAEQIKNGYLIPKSEKNRVAEAPVTLSALLKMYTQKLRGEGARHPEYLEDRLAYHLKEWLGRPFASITKAELFTRHQEIAADAKRGPMAAGLVIISMRALYSYASDAGKYTGDNLAQSIRVKAQTMRRRVILPAEFKKIIAELDSPAHGPWVKPYFRLAMLTGARRANIASMAWVDIDLDGPTWYIPADVAKAGEPIEIPLLPEAVEILKAQKEKHPESPWVFPAPKASCGHLVDPWRAWKRVLSNAGVKDDITIHDIRRSFGSALAAKGVPLSVIAEAMGHRNPATTAKHYIVNPAGAVRDALSKVLG